MDGKQLAGVDDIEGVPSKHRHTVENGRENHNVPLAGRDHFDEQSAETTHHHRDYWMRVGHTNNVKSLKFSSHKNVSKSTTINTHVE